MWSVFMFYMAFMPPIPKSESWIWILILEKNINQNSHKVIEFILDPYPYLKYAINSTVVGLKAKLSLMYNDESLPDLWFQNAK